MAPVATADLSKGLSKAFLDLLQGNLKFKKSLKIVLSFVFSIWNVKNL